MCALVCVRINFYLSLPLHGNQWNEKIQIAESWALVFCNANAPHDNSQILNTYTAPFVRAQRQLLKNTKAQKRVQPLYHLKGKRCASRICRVTERVQHWNVHKTNCREKENIFLWDEHREAQWSSPFSFCAENKEHTNIPSHARLRCVHAQVHPRKE